MSYLDRLKQKIRENHYPNELTKPTEPPFVSFVSNPHRHISENHASDLCRQWSKGIASLDADRPRGGYDPARWVCLVEDCRELLASFGQSAASFGWTAIDLFGVPTEGAGCAYPFGGLAWRMRGGRVICIDEYQAAYRMPFSGIVARCARGFLNRLSDPFVPVWELKGPDEQRR